ncbi:hypothetical protein NQ314_015274 [Rhamnusium bicolor]|uniref:Dehydrogenase/reductase SDR family member 11 n=1 Tax=Rhamnusium bicolor TaxID=1586634 RepID=A0AAV8WZ30_9CUCU|nr:hypothetical protein NQ314_015274 [Rhamnusium bicolor]
MCHVVVALARRKDRLDKQAKKLSKEKGKLYPLKTDITKEEDILNTFKWIKEHLGPVHILINSAGIYKLNNLSSGSTKDWNDIFQVNVFGLCIATREAVKDMKANNVDGHIVHINSIAGHKVYDFPKANVNPAAKFAVTALAETLRLELNSLKLKIKVTVILDKIDFQRDYLFLSLEY